MNWVSDRLFGKRPSYEEVYVANLYDAMVVGGGPSAEAESHLDAVALEIPFGRFERFASKRLIMLEAFLFVATNIATMPEDDEDDPLSMRPHPLAVQMGRHLMRKWADRGIFIADPVAVGGRCFDEVSGALETPFKWGREWLDEFYSDPEKAGSHYILWTDQCLKEFRTMKMVVEQSA